VTPHAIVLTGFLVTAALIALAGKHYSVTAMQYGFNLPQSVPADTPIVFDVTSRDVNRGFGIYDPEGSLIAQVQAMPDYIDV
jgi:hypothetical protein